MPVDPFAHIQLDSPLEIIDEDPSVPPVAGMVVAIHKDDAGMVAVVVLRLAGGQLQGFNLTGATLSSDRERARRMN